MLNIEVKNFLGSWISNQDESKTTKKQKNPDEKAKEQLERNKTNFEDWFGRDIGEGWHYLTAVFCMQLHPDINNHCQSCSVCNDFIIHGEDDFAKKLSKIESRLPERKDILRSDKEEFKTLIKYMLFSMPKKALPIGGNFTKAIRKAIKEASDLENIKICAFPTKEQRLVFSSKKAIIIGPWGCGKSWLMVDQAIEFAKNGENVVFGIFQYHERKGEPLILFDMELKFQEFPNVKVKLIPFDVSGENNLNEYTKEANIFFGDEFSDSLESGDKKNSAKYETVSFINSLDFCWLTISNEMYPRDEYEKKLSLREYIETWKPKDCNIIELKTPIRSTKEISEYLKKNLDNK